MKLRLTTMFALVLLQGCALLQPNAQEAPKPQCEPAAEPAEEAYEPAPGPEPQAATSQAEPSAVRHLRFIDRLNHSTPQQLDEQYARSARAFENKASIRNRLHLAWLWATPGHTRSNLWAARKQLRETLEGETLSEDLQRLVSMRLQEIERMLQLDQKLQEADAKIRALTTLEHSLEERDSEIQGPGL